MSGLVALTAVAVVHHAPCPFRRNRGARSARARAQGVHRHAPPRPRRKRASCPWPMLPFEVPPGTTLESLFHDVLPKAHARMIPAGAPSDRFIAVQRVD